MALASTEKNYRLRRSSIARRDTSAERDHQELEVLAFVRLLDGRLLYIRRWQVWMRTFRICGRSFDSGPGGADGLLDFLLSCCQRIIRDVNRAFFDLCFDHAV